MSKCAPRWIASISLVLLVATLALWLWSEDSFFLRIYDGRLVLLVPSEPMYADQYLKGDLALFHLPMNPFGLYVFATTSRSFLGFQYATSSEQTVIAMPVLALAIFPVIGAAIGYVLIRRQRRREQAGCCLVCGYDLRESNERCPECGTAVAKRKVLA